MSREFNSAPKPYVCEFHESGDRAVIGTELNTYRQQRFLEAHFPCREQRYFKDRQSFMWTSANLQAAFGAEGEQVMRELMKARSTSYLKARVFLASLANYLNSPFDIGTDFRTVPACIQNYPVHESCVYGWAGRSAFGTIQIYDQAAAHKTPFAVLVFKGDGYKRRMKKTKHFVSSALMALLHAEKQIDLKSSVTSRGRRVPNKPGPT